MTEEENARIAELASGAVNHTAEDVAQTLMDMVVRMEEECAKIRSSIEHFVLQLRKNTSIAADTVINQVKSCQQMNDAIKNLDRKFFGEDVTEKRTAPTVNSVGTGAVADALNPHPRIVESYDPDKLYER